MNGLGPTVDTEWLRERLGEDAARLDGGLAAWGGPLEQGEVSRASATFTPRPWPLERVASIEEVLRDRLPVGPPELLAEKFAAFGDAGVQRVFVWPVADEIEQLRRFGGEVVPMLAG